jgi:tetratricopeptide (TPR) repeat protein
LRYKYDRRGHRTTKRADPLAADFRVGGENNRTAFLKLVAGMLGVGLDELVQRETVRRQRRLAYVAAASLAGMAVTSGLAITAIQARDEAREQRREAEGLIGFMLGDLKDKLEPIGRLDALDGVGARVLTYYQRQGTSDLSDAALSQRSRALSLMGEVANLRGDMTGSLRLYREAMAGTAEAVRRNPDDPERLFEHSQNVFWIGALAQQRGEFGQAEAAYRQYRDLANAMVALQPENLKWRMEVEDSEVDLANVLLAQRRFAEATAQFAAAVQTMEAVSAVDPKSADYRKSVADSLAWLADAQYAQGKIGDAIDSRKRQVDLLRRMASQSGDVGYRERLVPALATLGRFLATSGDLPNGLEQVKESVTEGEALLPNDPTNSRWINYLASSKLISAQLLLQSGARGEANAQADAGCALTRKLIATDKSIVAFQTLLISCLELKAQLAASSGDYAGALQSAERGMALAKSVNTGDDTKMMRAERLVGDYRQRMGDSAGAQQAWQAGIALLSANARQRPSELAERSKLLQRLRQDDEARRIADYLQSIGYRNID